MKKYRMNILITTLILLLSFLSGCNSKSDELNFRKVEIDRVTFKDGESFDKDKMTIENSWLFEDNESMKVIVKDSIIGTLEPKATGKPVGDEYITYYVKVFHSDNSIEEWVFRLDEGFVKDGVAENKANSGTYKLIDNEDVTQIGQLIKSK